MDEQAPGWTKNLDALERALEQGEPEYCEYCDDNGVGALVDDHYHALLALREYALEQPEVDRPTINSEPPNVSRLREESETIELPDKRGEASLAEAVERAREDGPTVVDAALAEIDRLVAERDAYRQICADVYNLVSASGPLWAFDPNSFAEPESARSCLVSILTHFARDHAGRVDGARYAESFDAARRALAPTVNSLERLAVGDPLSGEDVYSVLEPAGDEDWESVDDSWDLESEE